MSTDGLTHVPSDDRITWRERRRQFEYREHVLQHPLEDPLAVPGHVPLGR